MQNETFFCNELDTLPATRIPAIALHWIFKLYGIMDTFFPVLLYGHKNRMKRTKKAKLTDFESLLVPPPAFHGEVDKEG